MKSKFFPTTCVDGFYDDPDEIREYALRQKFYPSDLGKYPGLRTETLDSLNTKMFEIFSNRLMNLFFDFDRSVTWSIYTCFQIIRPLSEDPDSPKNRGWIHMDEDTGHHPNVFNGLIYLNPSAHPDSGTSIFELNSNLYNFIDDKRSFFKDGTDNDYDNKMMKHESSFKESVRFQNRYNRMVCFDSSLWHRANSFYTNGDPRLFQIFFVSNIQSEVNKPCERMRSWKY